MKLLCLWVVVAGLLTGLVSQGEGFKQELRLSMKGGQGPEMIFDKNMEDLSSFQNLSSVDKYCSTGVWDLFERPNFEKHIKPLGSILEEKLHCESVNMTKVQSLRHWAAEDTSTDALSLYSDMFRTGNETIITRQVQTDIAMPVGSVAATGNCRWTLFAGKNLDGRSICFRVPLKKGYLLSWMNVMSIERKLRGTIGSVFKGCDSKEIKAYKKEHLL